MAATKLTDVLYDEPMTKFDSGGMVAAVGAASKPMTVIDRDALEALAELQKDKAYAKAQVTVGESKKKLYVVVYADKKKKAEVDKRELVKKWAKVKGGGSASVVSLDDDDDTIKASAKRMAKAKGTKVKTSGAFVKQADSKDIILLAHGSPIGEDTPPTAHASEFADKKPAAIVKWLIDSGLQPDYGGVVYVDGCFTASGTTGGKNFAKSVYQGLVDAGYEYLQVKGNIGSAITLSSGDEWSFPDDDDIYAEAKALLKAQGRPVTNDELEKLQKEWVTTAKRLRARIAESDTPKPGVQDLIDRLDEMIIKIGFRNIVGTFGPEKAKT